MTHSRLIARNRRNQQRGKHICAIRIAHIAGPPTFTLAESMEVAFEPADRDPDRIGHDPEKRRAAAEWGAG